MDSFRPQDFGFDFAFGTRIPLNASIGYYTVKKVEYYYGTTKDSSGNTIRYKNKTDLAFDYCGTEYFNFTNQT